MKHTLKKFAISILKRRGLHEAFELRTNRSSYLNEVGWFHSRRTGRPVDKNGNPIPWYSYPAIDFLDLRLRKPLRVFEYGSGNSTLFFATRVGEVVSVEHDRHWFSFVRESLPDNARLELHTEEDDYVNSIAGHGKFDVIVIDGMSRLRCAQESIHNLTDGGVVVWDNSAHYSASNATEYEAIRDFFLSEGFNELPFSGMAPVGTKYTQTSVIYRDENVFQI